MIHKKSRKNQEFVETSTYASRHALEDFTIGKLNTKSIPAKAASQIIKDELNLEGVPALNLASFVTTWMEPEADELIMKTINKNFIDHDEYPQIEKFHERCIHILADLLHAPENENYVGTATIGSAEAIMLACLSHKFNWRKKRKDQGLPYDKPNIIMGDDVQICWDKFARYFDVEPKIIPLKKDKYIISAEDVEPLIDENTICIGAILGTTFTGEYDEIEEINSLLLKVKRDKGWDIPIHVDGASGGFIAMFTEKNYYWDFKLPQVKSINLSGHKYGLVYPGVGWLIFRDSSVVADDLIFHVNYLGGNMPTYTLNFSCNSSMVVAQYYNFLRLGQEGYTKIISNMMKIADYLVESLEKIGQFKLLGTRRMEPVVSVALHDNSKYSVFDIAKRIREKGWIIPAYTLPPNAEEVESLRIVVREHLSKTLAHDLIDDLKEVIDNLEGQPSASANKTRNSAKNNVH